MDTSIYDLEFPYGRIEDFSIKCLAKNLFNQSDLNGWDTVLINEVVDTQKYTSTSIAKEVETFITDSGQEKDVVTTKGQDVHIIWKEQSTSWLPMYEVKSGNPIELVE